MARPGARFVLLIRCNSGQIIEYPVHPDALRMRGVGRIRVVHDERMALALAGMPDQAKGGEISLPSQV